MKILAKRQWVSWLRLSLLVFIAHVIILGLTHDWEIFSSKNGYPLVLDGFNFPYFYFIFLLYCNKAKKDECSESLTIGKILGILISLLAIVILICPEDIYKEGYGPNSLFVVLLVLGFSGSFVGTLIHPLKQTFVLVTSMGIIISLGIGFVVGLGNGFVIGFSFWVSSVLGAVFAHTVKKFIFSSYWKKIINWFMAREIEK